MDVLPDDLVRKCLLGVTYKSHDNLKAVCRGWEAMVSNPNFYADRKISGTSEQLICLIRKYPRVHYTITVCDPLKGTWEILYPFDDPECPEIPYNCRCVAVKRKLVFMGGFGAGALKSVYIYDFVSARWRRGANMPTPRRGFASSFSSSTGLIYVAGGVGDHSNPLASAEAYNVEEDKWEILPPMTQPRTHRMRGVFMEGKFIVISGFALGQRNTEIFDVSARRWRSCEDMWISLRGTPWERVEVATSSSDLYLFDKREVMKYNAEKNVWTALPTLTRDVHDISFVTQWRDSLFVGGLDVITHKRVYYLFNPSTGQLIEANSHGGGGYALSATATTIEI